MGVIAKPIPGFEQYYVAYSDGRIFSTRNNRFLKLKINKSHGYVECELNVNGKVYYKRVHRLIAETFLDNPNKYEIVNHINGVKTDNDVFNLEWTTPRNNNKHAIKNGLSTTKFMRRQYILYNDNNIIELPIEWTVKNEVSEFIGYSSTQTSNYIKSKKPLARGKYYGYRITYKLIKNTREYNLQRLSRKGVQYKPLVLEKGGDSLKEFVI